MNSPHMASSIHPWNALPAYRCAKKRSEQYVRRHSSSASVFSSIARRYSSAVCERAVAAVCEPTKTSSQVSRLQPAVSDADTLIFPYCASAPERQALVSLT